MQLLQKLVDLIKVTIPAYPPLILLDMCQEWDLCTSNTIQSVGSITLFLIFKHRRRRQFLLGLLPLLVAAFAKASDTMYPHVRQNTREM